MKKIILTAVLAAAVLCSFSGCLKVADEVPYETESEQSITLNEDSSLENSGVTSSGSQIFSSSEGSSDKTPSTASAAWEPNAYSAVEGRITRQQAEAMAQNAFGERDEATGNVYSYAYVQNIKEEETEYYMFSFSWVVDSSHISRIGMIFVSVDGKKVYQGDFYDGVPYIVKNINYLDDVSSEESK